MSDYPDLDKLVETCDYDTKLAVTAWVFKHIVDHAKEGGSYRNLIYGRLGFGTDAYTPLFYAGGMEISNEFDMDRMDEVKSVVRQNKIEALKSDLKEAEQSSDYYEKKCGQLQREVNRLNATLTELSAIHASEVIWAGYAKNCPRCKKSATSKS